MRSGQLIKIRALIAAAALSAALAACGGSSTVTLHSTAAPTAPGGSAEPGQAAISWRGCFSAIPVPGRQVTVTDPSGKVIGTGKLGMPSRAHFTAPDGVPAYPCIMPFTISNVPSQSRYGFHIKGIPGTIWETNVSKPVSLSVGNNGLAAQD